MISALYKLIEWRPDLQYAAFNELVAAARTELAQLCADLAQAQAERDAFAAESDAVHRTINAMCGTDTSTIEAVQHVINERDAARAELASNKVYQRMAARR